MTEPEQNRDEDDDRSEPILAPPTANPRRVQVPEEGLDGQTHQGHPETPEPPSNKEE
ncbi:hypothetical protein GCM10011608_26800 [Micromonospora sonchi]|uniref:Uncharacterized protein n=1 Tax=Micromonospora sonchi TaxID=1763543 RepID=A0A917TX77_9ACTN|nr:hypothetical protein [Micromonospora sonchi]GGM40632.1 hypothetical protein GCM10011608_26800 [Micromonospora sonchi]